VQQRPLVLASASPRRRELLARTGLAFEVDAPDVDETLREGTRAEEGACALAERKARAVAERHQGRDAFVLAADTIVAVDVEGDDAPRLLGKPANEFQARQMLRWLSGSRHRVVTGVCALRVRDLASRTAYERTFVSMRALAPDEIDAYVASQEWRDKAGGYAIQESADRFVTALEDGGFDNVVGLPVRLALELLASLDGPVPLAGPAPPGGSAALAPPGTPG
jgi:septum formation protein